MDESQVLLGDVTAPRRLMKEKFSPLINHSEINAPLRHMDEFGGITNCLLVAQRIINEFSKLHAV